MSSRKDRQIHRQTAAVVEALGIPLDLRKQVFALIKRKYKAQPHKARGGGVRIAAAEVQKQIAEAKAQRDAERAADE